MGLIRVLAGFGAFYPDCTPVGDHFSLDHEALRAKQRLKLTIFDPAIYTVFWVPL